jgi:putative addiction module component (TIGR02574 family)
MTVTRIKQQALALRPAQRLRLVQDIWDSLVREPDVVRIPPSHRKLIDTRLAEHENDPRSTITLAELKQRVNKRANGKRRK